MRNSNKSESYLIHHKLNTGYLNLYYKNYNKAELIAKGLLSDNEKLSIPDIGLEINSLSLLGDIRAVRKDYKQAKKYYEKALDKKVGLYSVNNTDLPYFYVNIAIADYHLGNYQSAINYYKKAILLIPNKKGTAYIYYYRQMGNTYYYVNKKESRKIYGEILEMDLDHELDTEIKADIYYMLGILDKEENKKESSLQKHLISRKLYNSLPSHYGEESLNLIRIAEHKPENRDFYTRYLNEAIIACLRKGKEYDPAKVPGYNNIVFPFLLIHSYKVLAYYYMVNNDLDEALDTLKIAKDLIALIKPMYRHDESRSSLGTESLPVYKMIVEVTNKKYNETGDLEYFELAFDAMEKSKSIHLASALKNHDAFENAGLPDSLFSYGQELKTEIDFLGEQRNALNETSSADKKKEMDDRMVDLYTEYNEYLIGIENDNEEYYHLKYAPSPIDIGKMKKTISPRDLVIQYHIQDHLLAIIAVGKEEHLFITKDIGHTEMDSLVHSFIHAINHKENELISKNARKLYDILLGGIIRDNSRYDKLIIIPDRIINYIPFGLLSKTDHPDSRIIHHASVVYDYSASKIYGKKKKVRFRNKFLGIAPTYADNKFAKLPYAKKEIEQISGFWKSRILEDEEANLENFRNYTKHYNIVHIAGHAEINDSFPLRSRLVFSELEDGSVESLYAYELYNMKLDMDMVALSACNSGVGKLREGEGSMSLARGFAYAGCPSTVTTLLPMLDEPSKDIMTLFYKNLAGGETKSGALRKAKLTYIQKGGPNIQDPIYWAGIVIIGSDVPLIESGFANHFLSYILLAVGALLLSGFVYKKYKNNWKKERI